MSEENKYTGKDRRQTEKHWHLDKRVPISLIFALLVQTGAITWFASDMSRRVMSLELTVNNNKLIIERVIRLEEQGKYTNRLLEEIRAELKEK